MSTTSSSSGRVAVTLAERAVWSAAFVDSLPDSSFLYIEEGGTKDAENKTVPRSLRHFPYRNANGEVDLPHLRNALARIPQSNLPQKDKDAATAKAKRILANGGEGQVQPRDNPPRENLVRGLIPAVELRDTGETMPTMTGHFAVFDEWTEINSSWEGNFLERISPSAFEKTFAENRNGIRVLFQHGKDPQIGDKPLGTINDLRADGRGAYYEVGLFDTSYNRDLIPGLKAGAYGASFRFKVMREDFNKRAEESDFNPRGLPERTILEAKVMEFGPVTFPAYEGATAGVRSLTDDYILRTFLQKPEDFAEMLRRTTGHSDAPSTETPAVATSPERRVVNRKFNSREDYLEWLNSLS